MADQSIKNLEDQQDEYDFKINTLKNRGEGGASGGVGCIRQKKTPVTFLEMKLKKSGSKFMSLFL